jgi:CRP/FNR family transcriptional regulator, cyclic AMP receptor protein
MKLKSNDFFKICLSIPFLACFSERELSEIESVVIVKKFSRNQVIQLEEEASDYFYFIYAGKVKVLQNNDTGKELLLTIHKRGDYFGEMSILDGKTAPATIVAIEDCTIGFLTKADFIKYIMNNENSLQQIIALLCSRLRDSWLMIKIFSFSAASDRIRAALNIFCHKFGTKDTRGIIINIKITHHDIANSAAVSRETVSRLISQMIKLGEIELIDNKYFLLTPSFFEKVPFM